MGATDALEGAGSCWILEMIDQMVNATVLPPCPPGVSLGQSDWSDRGFHGYYGWPG